MLIPTSSTAKEIVHYHRNKSNVVQESDFLHLTQRSRHDRVGIKITLASIMSRQCLPLGSFRGCSVQLPEKDWIEDQHFILYLDPVTAALHLRDTSSTGTWVCPLSGKRPIHLHCKAMQITSAMLIKLGSDCHVQFELHVDQEAVRSAMPAWIRSAQIFRTEVPRAVTDIDVYTGAGRPQVHHRVTLEMEHVQEYLRERPQERAQYVKRRRESVDSPLYDIPIREAKQIRINNQDSGQLWRVWAGLRQTCQGLVNRE